MTQQLMIEAKQKNDLDSEQFKRELEQLQNTIREEKLKREKLNKTLNEQSRVEKSGDVQIESFDTSGVLKRRLQKIIYKNKEKVKLIDAYIRNMTIIDGAFNQIKETTGITDIQEIQNTFIKSEEQNYSLLTYVDVLNQQSAHIKDQNTEVDEKIKEQERENVDKRRILLSTPDDEKFRRRVEGLLKQKQQRVSEFQSVLDKLIPSFENLLIKLAGSQFNPLDKNKLYEYQNGLILNDTTLENYLADLETFMTEILLFKAQRNELPCAITSTLQTHEIPVKDFKQKQLPQLAQYNLQRDPVNGDADLNNSLLDKPKFDKLAEELLDKRKNNPTIQTSQKNGKKQPL